MILGNQTVFVTLYVTVEIAFLTEQIVCMRWTQHQIVANVSAKLLWPSKLKLVPKRRTKQGFIVLVIFYFISSWIWVDISLKSYKNELIITVFSYYWNIANKFQTSSFMMLIEMTLYFYNLNTQNVSRH